MQRHDSKTPSHIHIIAREAIPPPGELILEIDCLIKFEPGLSIGDLRTCRLVRPEDHDELMSRIYGRVCGDVVLRSDEGEKYQARSGRCGVWTPGLPGKRSIDALKSLLVLFSASILCS